MRLRELTLLQCMLQFENIGFMEWHARVLSSLELTPKSIKEIAREAGLFHYHVEAIVNDLIGLHLVEYTRKGIQIVNEFDLLHALVQLSEDSPEKNFSLDYEAAFEVVHPKVLALKRKFDFDE